MDLQTAKIKNYFHWLKQRGQRWPITSQQSPLRKSINYLFFEDERRTDIAGQELFQKILVAMKLRPDEYAVCAWDDVELNSFLSRSPKAFVALGSKSAQIFEKEELIIFKVPTLIIPHPLEMIANPTLKREAWTNLQALQKSLDPVLGN